eukprot:8228073-Pyramimonas_sp.AAC.1
MYFPDVEGVGGQKGRQMMSQVGEFWFAPQKPFVIAADFNATPSEAQNVPFPGKMRGAVVYGLCQ